MQLARLSSNDMNAVNNMKLLGTALEAKKRSIGALALKFNDKVCCLVCIFFCPFSCLCSSFNDKVCCLVHAAIRKSVESERNVLEKKQTGNYLGFIQWLRYVIIVSIV